MVEIEGKVIGILDSHTFVIDRGLLDGVRLKDFVFVYKEEKAFWDNEINDSISQKIPSKILRVISVQKKIAQVSTLLERFEYNQVKSEISKNKVSNKQDRWNFENRIKDLVYFNSLTSPIKVGNQFFMKTETNPIEILI